MSHFYQPDDDTWEGRMDSYIEEAEKQITALRAALDQERADNAKLRALLRGVRNGEAYDFAFDDIDGRNWWDVRDALLSGRG